MAVTNSEIDILRRSFALESGVMPREVAEWILCCCRFAPDDYTRMMELLGRSKEGELSEDEDAELARFANVRRLLDLLKLESLKVA